MNLRSVYQRIESIEFSAYLNLVSGLEQFYRVMSETEEIKTLIGLALGNKQVQSNVLRRLAELTVVHTDPAYENPNDVALAAYTFVLDRINSKYKEIAATKAIEVPRCWWAIKTARRVLLREQTLASIEEISIVNIEPPSVSSVPKILKNTVARPTGTLFSASSYGMKGNYNILDLIKYVLKTEHRPSHKEEPVADTIDLHSPTPMA